MNHPNWTWINHLYFERKYHKLFCFWEYDKIFFFCRLLTLEWKQRCCSSVKTYGSPSQSLSQLRNLHVKSWMHSSKPSMSFPSPVSFSNLLSLHRKRRSLNGEKHENMAGVPAYLFIMQLVLSETIFGDWLNKNKACVGLDARQFFSCSKCQAMPN